MPQAEETDPAPPTLTHHLALLLRPKGLGSIKSGYSGFLGTPGGYLGSMDVREVPCCLESDLAIRKLRLSRESASYPPGPPHLPFQLPLCFSSPFRPHYIRLTFSLLCFLPLPQAPNCISTACLPLLPLYSLTALCLVQHISSVSPCCNLLRSQFCNVAQHGRKLHFPSCFSWWSSSTEVNPTGKFWWLESLLMPRHCSFLLPASHSHFTKTSFSVLLLSTFLLPGRSSITAEVCNTWKQLHMAVKTLPCLDRNCHLKAETAEGNTWLHLSHFSLQSDILTNSILPSQFKPRSWALPGRISTYSFPINSAITATAFSRGSAAT